MRTAVDSGSSRSVASRQRFAAARRPTLLWRSFLGALGLLALVLCAALAYLLAGPATFAPYAWQPGASADLSGRYVPNDALTRGRLVATRWVEPGNFERIRYQGVGPETIAVGPDGNLYAGLCDAGLGGTLTDPPACRLEGDLQGWVVRVNPKDPHDVEPYVRTGGRPLGLAFDATGKLYIADGIKGLLRVESNLAPGASAPGAIAEVSAPFHTIVPVATCNRDDDKPDRQPGYADSVAIGPDGSVWFTCPSQRWSLAEIRMDIFENQPTGRLLRYQPCTAADPLRCPKDVLADDLMYANGIAVIESGRALLVNEWAGFRITRLELRPGGGPPERSVFVDNLPGYPDNLSVGPNGTLWVGLSIKRQALIDRFRPHPVLMQMLERLPATPLERHAWVIGLSERGELLWNLQDTSGFFNQATGAYAVGDALHIGSYTDSSMLCITRPGAKPDQDPCDPWAKPSATVAAAVQP
jgi:sugar lactone lactonase YvrE